MPSRPRSATSPPPGPEARLATSSVHNTASPLQGDGAPQRPAADRVDARQHRPRGQASDCGDRRRGRRRRGPSGPATPPARPALRHHGAFPLAGAICATPLRSRVRKFESCWGRLTMRRSECRQAAPDRLIFFSWHGVGHQRVYRAAAASPPDARANPATARPISTPAGISLTTPSHRDRVPMPEGNTERGVIHTTRTEHEHA
jgi:hypothetical protein